MSFTAGEQIK